MIKIKFFSVNVMSLMAVAILSGLALFGWAGPALAQEQPPAVSQPEPAAANPSPSGLAASQAGEWATEVVVIPTRFDSFMGRNLQIDSQGYLHLLYNDNGLYYARYDGSQWRIHVVDGAPRVGEHAALALAPGSGYLHASYYDATNGDLKYAHYDGSAWAIQTVDSAGEVGLFTALAVDAAGRPHISYYDNTNQDLKYAIYSGTTWLTQTLDSAGNVGRCTSLGLDSAGRPHIAYADGGSELRHAWYSGTTWYTETVDSYEDTGGYASLVMDSNNYSHISYYSRGNLKYAWQDGQGWHIETAAQGYGGVYEGWTSFGFYTSLALDGNGRPHISHTRRYSDRYGNAYDTLEHTWHDGASWQSERAPKAYDDAEYYTLLNTAVALDASNHVHIVYYNTWYVEHTWHNGSSWQTEQVVDHLTGARSGTSLALDSLGRPHMSYCTSSGGMSYARYDGAQWHIESVALGECDRTALELDQNDNPRVLGCSASGLRYAWRAGETWQVEVVDGNCTDDASTPLALDGAGYPHTAYTIGNNGWVYTWRDATRWYTQPVTTTGYVNDISLALDNADQPHIMYYSAPSHSGSLIYARRDGSGWHIGPLAHSEGPSFSEHEMALDSAGLPHIVYLDLSWNTIYARFDGTTWITDTLAIARYSHDISLALDRADRPHLAYTDDTRLIYMWHNGSTWLSKMVENAYYWRGDSLALDSAGLPHIGYCDTQSLGLRHAWLQPLALSMQATVQEGLRNRDILTYTLTLSGAGQNARLWDTLPFNVQYVSGSLTSTLTPTVVYSPSVRAVIWEGKLPTSTLGMIRFQVTPGITGPGSLNLALPIVNTAWLTDTDNNVAVSATVTVNGHRVYLPLVVHNSN